MANALESLSWTPFLAGATGVPGGYDAEAGGGANQVYLGNDSRAYLAARQQFPNAASFVYRNDGGQTIVQGLDANGQPIPGATTSVGVDTGNFLRDAALVIGGGYLGGSALAGSGGAGAVGTGALEASGTAGAGAGVGATGGAGLGGAAYGATDLGALGGGGLLTGGGTAGGAAGAAGAAGGAAAAGGGMGGYSGWAQLASNLIGSAIQSNAVSNAAGDQRAATAEALSEQRRQYDLNRQDLAPWRTAGQNALGQLVDEMGRPVTSADVMADPGYQFGLDQGQQAIDRKIAAAGGRVSGAAIKAAARFGTNYATTGYGAAYQRRQDRLNRLAALAGIGQTATNTGIAAGQSGTNAITNLISNQGDATGAANLAQGGIWGNAFNQIGALYGRNQQPQQPGP